LLEVYVPLGRTYVINMVGAFYNTFMPGSTGRRRAQGVLRRQTGAQSPHARGDVGDRGSNHRFAGAGHPRRRAAGYQYFTSSSNDPVTPKVRTGRALGSAPSWGTIVGCSVFYNPLLRRISGLDFIMRRLPMQAQVQKAVHTMEILRPAPVAILWATAITLPVHGHGRRVRDVCREGVWTADALGVLLGRDSRDRAQRGHPDLAARGRGNGVLRDHADAQQGVTISQAFALTMSLRAVQILWNLTGGLLRPARRLPQAHDGGADQLEVEARRRGRHRPIPNKAGAPAARFASIPGAPQPYTTRGLILALERPNCSRPSAQSAAPKIGRRTRQGQPAC
jgi:hypothetical protein